MSRQAMVKVWDPLVRISHWSVVILFVVAYLTGEDDGALHIYSGYVILGLVVVRILWGVVGTKYARFADFVYSPGATLRYVRGLLGGRPAHYLGHNPLGGYMTLLLLIMLLIVTITGLKVYGVEGHGPLAVAPAVMVVTEARAEAREEQAAANESEGDEESAEEFWEEIHEVASNITLALIVLHILGVVVSSWRHKENLVLAMITGKKKAPPPQ